MYKFEACTSGRKTICRKLIRVGLMVTKSISNKIKKIKLIIFDVDGVLTDGKKTYDKNGILIETSVSNEILLANSKNIISSKNNYHSNYCNGPCGLVDIFNYNNNIGCYETNKVSFENIKPLKSFKNLQRWDKKVNNSQFILNPVGCIKKIDVKNIIELIKNKLKES